MKKIELKILYSDAEQARLEELGIRPNIEDIKTRFITFYNIDCVSPYYEDGKEFSVVRTGSFEYICIMKYSDILEKIENEFN